MTVKTYRDLIVWQRAMDLTVACYELIDRLPQRKKFALCVQLQKAAVSVPSNIAEGQGRSGTKEFLYHLSIARGSLFEVETQVILSERLKYVTTTTVGAILATTAEVGR